MENASNAGHAHQPERMTHVPFHSLGCQPPPSWGSCPTCSTPFPLRPLATACFPSTAAVPGLQPPLPHWRRALPSAPGPQAQKLDQCSEASCSSLIGAPRRLQLTPPPARLSFPNTQNINGQVRLKMRDCPCTFLKRFTLAILPW